jgi:hypothetical protein
MTGLLALALKYWKPLAVVAIVGGMFIAWQFDRAAQYRRGVSEAHAAMDAAISKAEGLVNEERNRARDAATRAARALCVENDIDPAVCAGL